MSVTLRSHELDEIDIVIVLKIYDLAQTLELPLSTMRLKKASARTPREGMWPEISVTDGFVPGESIMPAPRAGAVRSLLFLNTLLLTSAMAVPAMAQIEEVVVTAQKKTEDVQIRADRGDRVHRAGPQRPSRSNQFKDLQFHAPNVHYTAGNFGGADFSDPRHWRDGRRLRRGIRRRRSTSMKSISPLRS